MISTSGHLISKFPEVRFHRTRISTAVLGEALEVGVEWLLHGKERNMTFPADRKMMEWLKDHPKIREKIWKMMEN